MAKNSTSQKINSILKSQPKVSLDRINLEKIRTQGIKINNIPMVKTKKTVKRLTTKKANVKIDCCATKSSPDNRSSPLRDDLNGVSTRSAFKKANVKEDCFASSSSTANSMPIVQDNEIKVSTRSAINKGIQKNDCCTTNSSQDNRSYPLRDDLNGVSTRSSIKKANVKKDCFASSSSIALSMSLARDDEIKVSTRSAIKKANVKKDCFASSSSTANSMPTVQDNEIKVSTRSVINKGIKKKDCCTTNSSPADSKVSTRSAIRRANIGERLGETSSSLGNDVSSIPSNKTTHCTNGVISVRAKKEIKRSTTVFNEGDLLLVQWPYFPYWPAVATKIDGKSINVKFFGDAGRVAKVNISRCVLYLENLDYVVQTLKSRQYYITYSTAIRELEIRHNVPEQLSVLEKL